MRSGSSPPRSTRIRAASSTVKTWSTRARPCGRRAATWRSPTPGAGSTTRVHRGQRRTRAGGSGAPSPRPAAPDPARVHRAQHPGQHGGPVAISGSARGVGAPRVAGGGDGGLGARLSEPQRAPRGSLARAGRRRLSPEGARRGPCRRRDLPDRLRRRSHRGALRPRPGSGSRSARRLA